MYSIAIYFFCSILLNYYIVCAYKKRRAMVATVAEVEVVILPDGRMDTVSAAAYVGVAPKTLAMWRWQGIGPRFIKRGRIFYYREDLDARIGRAKRVNSTAQAKFQAVQEAEGL
jgi:hypothetical protein